MKNLFKRFVREEEGQDLIEYALLLGLITVLLVGIITTISGQTQNLYNLASDALTTAGG